MQADKEIKNIQELLDLLEEIIDEYTDLYQRRDIINIINFVKRQRDAGRTLEDIAYWLVQMKDQDYADVNTLIDRACEVQ